MLDEIALAGMDAGTVVARRLRSADVSARTCLCSGTVTGGPAAEPERDWPEEDLPPTADLPVLLDERLTVPLEREVPPPERLTLEEERPALEDDLDALLPVVPRLF